ncbi:MAG: class I SAM-dependent methyltransferase [Chitinophagaceae bacterium]|nr:class I SAM-dependent methyltransferase [Chitinophagaceae bacterium]MCW5904889.1 class I SAM-dependent methyltransferase [Chitinophagaceae bacterium]
MFHQLKKIKGKFTSYQRQQQRNKVNAFCEKYIQENNLQPLLDKVNAASNSTGAELYDYVTLHSYITTHKPQYILECGTGKSTWILAHALQQNHLRGGVKGIVISMESIEHWYNEAKNIFPEELKEYAEIHHSPATTYMYSFIKGTAFTQVPDYPYDFVFVDGPELTITENGNSYETVNMDFIRFLLSSNKTATAIIDSRLRTSLAYGNIFGKDKVKFLKPWQVGIIQNVSKKDMLLHVDGVPLLQMLKQNTDFKYDNPEWLKNKL